MDPATKPMLDEMLGADGKPKVCDRVWISSIGCTKDDTTEQTGKLTAGFGATTQQWAVMGALSRPRVREQGQQRLAAAGQLCTHRVLVAAFGAYQVADELGYRPHAAAQVLAQFEHAFAHWLGITEGTVKWYLHNLYEKFGVGELVNLSRHHCFSDNFILHLYRVVTQFNANDQSLNSKFLNILTD